MREGAVSDVSTLSVMEAGGPTFTHTTAYGIHTRPPNCAGTARLVSRHTDPHWKAWVWPRSGFRVKLA